MTRTGLVAGLATCLRSLTHLVGLLLAGQLATGSSAASTPPAASESVERDRPAIEELDAIRADLLDKFTRRDDHPGRLAQWPNWPNWPNWGNFWRNW